VGTILRNCSRETDIAARFGGDEFVIVLPDTGSGGALAVARRVRNTVRSHVFLEDFEINSRLTASVGVVTVSGAALSADELLQAADDAMYAVKAKGKDGVQIATVSRQADSLLGEGCSA
jgi:diguanylate cyclase (GGDEF)-like protein